MKQNVCSPFEQALRVFLGLALLSLLLFLEAPVRHLGWFGLLPMATATFGYCPLSARVGLNTCRIRHS